MKGKCLLTILGWLLTLNFVVGCTPAIKREERMLSRLRPAPAGIETVELSLDRQALLRALERVSAVERLRLVEIFTSRPEAGPLFPEYRLFDVEPGSVYHLMGLRNADILIAANDRILVNPVVFKQYVRLLPNEKEAQVHIKRGGKEILLKYRIVDAAAQASENLPN